MNNKFTVFALLAFALVAVVLCGSTVFLFNNDEPVEVEVLPGPVIVTKTEKPEIEEKTKIVKREEKTVKPSLLKTDNSLTEEEKKTREAKDWEEAGKEMNELFQGSKMQELMKKKMIEGNKQWFDDLFDKYSISDGNREIIAVSVTEAQTEYFNELMAHGFLKNADEAKRAEVADKLKAIDADCENEIKEAGGEAFLAEAKEQRKNELRNQYLNRVDYGLGKNKMSDKQRVAMNELYERNQITESELWTLPRNEVEERQENIQSGAKDILDEKQYQRYLKTNKDPFNFK